jgi:hypothetical protein
MNTGRKLSGMKYMEAKCNFEKRRICGAFSHASNLLKSKGGQCGKADPPVALNKPSAFAFSLPPLHFGGLFLARLQ